MRQSAANEIQNVLNDIELEFTESSQSCSQSRSSYLSSNTATEQSPNQGAIDSENQMQGSSHYLRETSNR